ncbi:hypothetical protein BHS04_17660 [Myxococcus xanthus]|nr:hypothetical protein BHS04_17660 [Myxococcus xanthus]
MGCCNKYFVCGVAKDQKVFFQLVGGDYKACSQGAFLGESNVVAVNKPSAMDDDVSPLVDYAQLTVVESALELGVGGEKHSKYMLHGFHGVDRVLVC